MFRRGRARGVGADVVQVEVRTVVVVAGAQLRECLNSVVQEEVLHGDGIVGPVVVGDRQHGGARDEFGAGGGDQVGDGRVVGVAHTMTSGHELADELEARQDVADDGDADHRDMGRATGHG